MSKLQDWQKRLIVEEAELMDKFSKLTRFIVDEDFFPNLPIEERELLMDQHHYMSKYRMILEKRIARFNDENK